MRTIVLDTNCLLAVLPSISPYHRVWIDILSGVVSLCVSNEVLEEYEEILGKKTNPAVAQAVVRAILEAPGLKRVEPTFFYHMITADPDDNKFVDCAIKANARYIVTEDRHFNVLKTIDFPHIDVINLNDFLEYLRHIQ